MLIPNRPLPLLGLALLLLGAAAGPPRARAQAYGETVEATAVRQAISEYQQTGVARVLEVGQTIIVPYGQVDPVLKTAVLRTTLIELDRNEYVIDRIIGDSLRWSVNFAIAGEQDRFRQLVSVKPRDQDITTSLVLTTNFGRIYQFMLDSEPYPIEATQNPVDIPYTRHVKFYYPDGALVEMPPPREAMMAVGAYGEGAGSADGGSPVAGPGLGMLNVAELNTGYDLDADPAFPCPPGFVADDGTRFIVQFPDAQDDPLCSTRFPLYAVDENGDLQLLNYEVFGGNTYIADRIPAEAVLLYVTERKQQREVRILNRTLRERLRQRRPNLTESAFLRLGGGLTLPTATDVFRDTYQRGYRFDGGLGLRLSSRLDVGLDVGYGSVAPDEALVAEALEDVLNGPFSDMVAERLTEAGALGEGEEIVEFVQAGGARVTTRQVGLGGRYFLVDRSGYRRQRWAPYAGLQLGLAQRRTSELDLNVTAQIVGADGERRTDPALDEIVGEIYTMRADPDFRNDPQYRELRTFLSGGYGSGYVFPDWLFTAGTSKTFLDLGFSLGVLVELRQGIGLALEAGYSVTPLASRAYKGFIPVQAALQFDL